MPLNVGQHLGKVYFGGEEISDGVRVAGSHFAVAIYFVATNECLYLDSLGWDIPENFKQRFQDCLRKIYGEDKILSYCIGHDPGAHRDDHSTCGFECNTLYPIQTCKTACGPSACIFTIFGSFHPDMLYEIAKSRDWQRVDIGLSHLKDISSLDNKHRFVLIHWLMLDIDASHIFTSTKKNEAPKLKTLKSECFIRNDRLASLSLQRNLQSKFSKRGTDSKNQTSGDGIILNSFESSHEELKPEREESCCALNDNSTEEEIDLQLDEIIEGMEKDSQINLSEKSRTSAVAFLESLLPGDKEYSFKNVTEYQNSDKVSANVLVDLKSKTDLQEFKLNYEQKTSETLRLGFKRSGDVKKSQFLCVKNFRCQHNTRPKLQNNESCSNKRKHRTKKY